MDRLERSGSALSPSFNKAIYQAYFQGIFVARGGMPEFQAVVESAMANKIPSKTPNGEINNGEISQIRYLMDIAARQFQEAVLIGTRSNIAKRLTLPQEVTHEVVTTMLIWISLGLRQPGTKLADITERTHPFNEQPAIKGDVIEIGNQVFDRLRNVANANAFKNTPSP